MLRVEFHCHTIYSKDSLTQLEKFIAASRAKGLDRVIITDHNTIAGAVAAKELAPDLIIIGEEIMTSKGELLTAFVQEELPKGLPPQEAITRLREQGAFISVSHPFDIIRDGHWEEQDLLEILPLIDAIEVFNARCFQAKFNERAQEFARQHNLLGTVGSDAHAAFELGRASMLLPDFHNAITLKQAISLGTYDAKLSSPWVHFTSRYASWRKSTNKASAS